MRIEIEVLNDNIRLSEEMKLHLSKKLYKHIKGYNSKIYLNGKPTETYVFVNKGDIISIDYIKENNTNWPLYESKLDIYYEDDNYLVVNKPNNLLSIPTKAEPFSLYQQVLYYLKNNNDLESVSILNRLDKDTEGLVLVAKNTLAASLMNPIHEKMTRKYLALVHGKFDNKESEIILNIKKENENSFKRIVSSDGKISITNYKVIEEYDNSSLVEFSLKTGRTHQIRVVSSYLSHPLYGDKIYGFSEDTPLKLLSYYIEFINPFSNELVKIELNKPNW